MVDCGSDVTASDGISGCFLLSIQLVLCLKVQLKCSVLTIRSLLNKHRELESTVVYEYVLVHHTHGGTHYKCVVSFVIRIVPYGLNIC